MSVRYVIFLLILFQLNIASCREEKPVGPPDGSSEDRKEGSVLEGRDSRSPADFIRPKRALNFGDQGGDGEQTTDDDKTPMEGEVDQIPSKNSLKDMTRTRIFFERIGDEAYYPADMVIGQMVKEPEATGEERKVLDLLKRWVGSLGGEARDNRNGDFYSAGSGEILKRRFQGFTLPIEEVRFGRMEFKDGLVRLDMRFFSGQGRTAGEIVLKLSDGEWRIQAVDVDLKALQHPYEPPDYEKDPPVYGTMQL